mgnify:FL=1
MSEVIVTIFNHNYRLAVSTGEEELLKNCAKLVDDQMSAVRASGKVIALDQIAVLSALEIAYDAQKKEDESAARLAEASEEAKKAQEAARQAAEDALKAQQTAEAEPMPAAAEAATATATAPAPAAPADASASQDAAALEEIRALCRLCEEALYKDATLGLRL